MSVNKTVGFEVYNDSIKRRFLLEEKIIKCKNKRIKKTYTEDNMR